VLHSKPGDIKKVNNQKLMGNIISDIVANKGKTITTMGENVFLIHFAPETDK